MTYTENLDSSIINVQGGPTTKLSCHQILGRGGGIPFLVPQVRAPLQALDIFEPCFF